MAEKKDRVGYGVKPPYISLKDALQITKRIYEDAAGVATEDQLSTIFDNTVKSSSYTLKLNAIKSFMLVQQDGKKVSLTENARQIVAPTSPEERAQAIKAAFLNIDLYKKLFDLWAGKILPVEEFFLNTIRERGNIPSELTRQWKESFMASGEAAGLFQPRADGKIQLRMEPSQNGGELPEGGGNLKPTDPVRPPEKPSPLIPPKEGCQRFPIYLTGDERIAFVELPKGWSQADIRKLMKVMAVMFETEEKE